MNNAQNTFWEKKLPPFSGLVLVAVLLMTITWLTGNVVMFGTRAAIGGVPQKVKITNVTDTSFTVTYQTDYPVLGSIKYGTGTLLNGSALDDRDQLINKVVEHRVHHITVNNLTPGTKYVFEISSGGETYKNSDAFYEVTTGPPLSTQATALPPVGGQVELDDARLPAEGVIFVQSSDSQILSALLKPDGSYSIPIDTLRNKDLSGSASITPNTELTVTVEVPNQETTTAVVLASHANSTPLMVLSKQYDFSIATDASGSAQASDSANTSPVDLPIPVDTTAVSGPAITVPTANQSFNDLQPSFEGKAIAGTPVAIVIETQPEISAIVQADENSNWKYRPQAPLSPGVQKITVLGQNSQGTEQTVSESFTILAQGSQFIEPSVSPPPVITPVALPTITSEPTIEPTMTIAPPTPTIEVTPDPNATRSPTINPNHGLPTVPDSGSSAWFFGIAAIVFAAGAGALLFFFI